MAALTQDTPLKRQLGSYVEYPMLASTVIYEGSMVGLSSGYARALVAGDTFVGHCIENNTEGTAANAGENVKVLRGNEGGPYELERTLASVAVTDVGKDVYASDDATHTLTQGSNSPVGKVAWYVTTNTCVVRFTPLESDVTNHEHTAVTNGGVLTSPRVVTAIADTNGNELIIVTATASAVNEVTLANAATGNGPTITASGETNVPVTLAAKGTGAVTLGQATSAGVDLAADQPIRDSSANELIKFTKATTAVNEITVANAATGNGPSIISTGETNVALGLAGKGTGTVTVGQATGSVQLGTVSTDKIGTYGATPVVRAANIIAVTGGSVIDVESRTAINALLTAVKNLGLIASA